MKLQIVLILLVSTAAFGAQGLEPVACHCEQYEGLLPFSKLGSEISQLTLALPHEGGRTPGAVDEQIAALRVRLDAETNIPFECRGYLLKKLSLNGSALAVPMAVLDATRPALPTNADSILALYDTVATQQLYGDTLARCGKIDPSDQGSEYLACLAQATDAASRETKAYWRQKASVILSGLSWTPKPTEADIKIIQTYQDFLNTATADELLKKIAAKGDGLSNEQFLRLVLMFGSRGAQDYNTPRSQGLGPQASGPVTIDQILAAARVNTAVGSPDADIRGLGQNRRAYGGICRDIASLQGSMLAARGFKDTYVLSFALTDDYHSTVITRDPVNRAQLYAIDYSTLTPVSGVDGGRALFQNSPATVGSADASLNYYLARPGGATAGNIASVSSKFLTEAAGFNVRNQDVLARAGNSLVTSNTEILAAADSRAGPVLGVRAVGGHDELGARYVALTANVAYGDGTLVPGKVALLLGDQVRPAGVYGTSGDEHLGLTYLQLEQHVKTPSVILAAGTALHLDSSVNALGAISMPLTGVQQAKVNAEGALRARAEVIFENTPSGAPVRSQLRIGVQASPGCTDVRDSGSKPALVWDGAYLGANEVLHLSELELAVNAMLVTSNLGTRAEGSAALSRHELGLQAYASGRVTDDSTLYQDSSLRRGGISATYTKPFGLVGVSAETPLEGQGQWARTRVMASAVVTDDFLNFK